jgi:hypothetical protein
MHKTNTCGVKIVNKKLHLWCVIINARKDVLMKLKTQIKVDIDWEKAKPVKKLEDKIKLIADFINEDLAKVILDAVEKF